jgi:hypothetical protein
LPFDAGGVASLLLDRSLICFSDGLFRRGDLREGGGDDLSGLRIVDKLIEGGKQFLLGLAVQVGGILAELELRLLVLHLHDQLDGIQVDALTGVCCQRTFERLGDLLAEVLANVVRQPDGDPLLSAWPTLASTRTTQPALVDHLEGSDLWVAVVLLVGWQLRASPEGV